MVLLLAVVGPVVVLQQTPRAVTAAPPLSVILPPLEAVVLPRPEIAVVVRVGIVAAVVNETSLPYVVPGSVCHVGSYIVCGYRT